MKVAIDARIEPGLAGGVAVAVKSLVQGLARLEDADDEYVVIVEGDKQRDWFQSFLGPRQRVVMRPRPQHGLIQRLKLRLFRPVARYARGVIDRRLWPEVPLSDGFYESLSCDVVHFPTQSFTVCALPSVYNPHDLQHLRYPQFFSPWILAWRETVYRAGCHLAQTVVVGSQWIKDDLIRQYRIDPGKIQVVPEAAPTQPSAQPSQGDLARVRMAYQLKEPFVLFPGVTWPHKNHLQLFRALAHLRDERGLLINLVCTGSKYLQFWPQIEDGIRRYSLAEQVRFLGHVPEADLRSLYRLASCLVLPSLYEASSLPIFEAWLDGLPVTCSNVAALPEQVRDAALLFDPTDHTAIADAVAAAALDSGVQHALRTRGCERLKDFDMLRTARTYRAVYRRAGGFPLDDEDRCLLQSNWMTGPRQ